MNRSAIYLLFVISMIMISCEEILFEEDISTAQVEIVSPIEGSVIKASNVSFHWTLVEGANSYQVQIATPDFEQPQQLVVDIEVEENSFSEELFENEYEWRVRALNSGYSTPFVSAGFTIEDQEDFSSRRVILVSPTDDLVTNQNNINLQWMEVEGAAIYRIQIMEMGNLIKEQTTDKTEINLNFPDGEFIWKVRAENETQNTFYSSRKILIDVSAPAIPELIKPADEADLSTESVTFEWERESTPGATEIDSLFVFQDVKLEKLVEKEQVTTSYNSILQRQKTYYWYIRSYDKAGNISEPSEVFSFTIN